MSGDNIIPVGDRHFFSRVYQIFTLNLSIKLIIFYCIS